jgi:hypothetical protein
MRATLVRVLLVIAALVLCATAAAAFGPRKAIRPADQARARKIMLALSDLPSGWKAEAPPSDNSSPTAPKCAHVTLSDLTETADVQRQFGHGALGIPAVNSAVGMLKSRAQADAFWQRVPTERVLSCETRSGAGLPKGSHVSFRKLASPRIGNRSVAWQLAITTTQLPSPIYAEIVFANKGRTFSVLSLENLGSPFDRALARRLVRAAGARLNRYAA